MGIDPVSLAITIALDAAMMAITASQKIEGPRVSDLSASVADYGTPVPQFIGTSRLECPCFYCEPIKEVKKRRKTKGGKYNEYTYFGTWASLIGEQEILGINRVFFDYHLVYDAQTGESALSGLTGYEFAAAMRIYYGTEDQTADERMVAYVEDQEGPGRCPDYLGVAYLFFEDLPLEKLGNRFPQVSVIASTNIPDVPIEGTVDLAFWHNAPSGEFVKDLVRMGIAFLDIDGIQIGSTTWSALKSNTGWHQESVSATAPADCFGIRFFMDIAKGFGTHPHYGFIDDVTATLNGEALPLLNPGAEGEPDLLSHWTDTTGFALYLHSSATGDGVIPHGGSLMFGGNNSTSGSGRIVAYQDITAHTLTLALGAGAGITLQDVCEYLSDLVGLSPSDYDFSNFDQEVYGYSWTQGAAKDIIAPLLDVHDCDIRPSGFLIEGRKRGAIVEGTDIIYERMVREGGRDGGEGDPLYEIRTTSESDIPRRIFFTFADPNSDHQPNTAVFQRNAASVGTNRELSIDMTTLALLPSAAQPLVERYLRRRWTGSVTLTCKLEPAEMIVDPADVRNLLLEEDIAFRGRLIRVSRQANRVMRTTWEQDSAAVNVVFSSPGAEAIGRPPAELYLLADTQGFALDVPLLIDAHDQTTPFLYLAAGPSEEGKIWPGADFWKSDSGTEGTYVSGWDGVGSSQAAAWGRIVDTLPDALSSVVDEGTELVINLFYGELVSIDEATFEASATTNIAVVGSSEGGWEIIQFRDAVLQSVDADGIGQYILTGLRRGMRGTEAQTAEHQSDELFLLLDSSVKTHDMGASEIGKVEYLRVATLGTLDETGDAITVDYTAAAQRPYSPVHPILFRDDVTDDWAITFVRRSRIGGALIDGRDVPLGETSELYRVRILDGSLGAIRTIEVTTQSATYTAAQQVADWGVVQTSLSVEIVQVAPDLDLEGFPLAAAA